MYSITNPPFSYPAFPLLSNNLKSWLTIRNDDIYNMRWANIDFARQYIKSIPEIEKIAGFYMGPDGFLWGRDYLEKTNNKELVFKKQWVSNMLWGQLAYNPNTPDSIFHQNIKTRFKNTDEEKLMKAWSAASMIFPLTTRFFWGDIDLKWFPEANFSHKKSRGFWDIVDDIQTQPMEGSRLRGILSWADLYLTNTTDSLISPLQEADSIAQQAQIALVNLKALGKYDVKGKSEKDQTLGDIEAFAHIGNFYAEKLRAASYLALYDKYQMPQHQEEALFHIQQALNHWKKYAEIYDAKYQAALYNRVGFVDVIALTKEVEKDVETVKNWIPGKVKLQNNTKTEVPFKE
jgi:hypothetical protein